MVIQPQTTLTLQKAFPHRKSKLKESEDLLHVTLRSGVLTNIPGTLCQDYKEKKNLIILKDQFCIFTLLLDQNTLS